MSLRATRMPRPPPPAAALISTGIADLVRPAAAPRPRSSISPSLPGTTGTPAFLASLRASFLLPSRRMASCGGPMNSMLQSRHTSAKCGVFREEAVAGMDGLHVGDLGGADDAADLEIALGGGGRADADGLVGQVEIGGAAVGLAEDGHDLDAQIAAGADDPQGDLTAIGNQDALKHEAVVSAESTHVARESQRQRLRHLRIRLDFSALTSWPHLAVGIDPEQHLVRTRPAARSRRRISAMTPLHSAGISLKIFMASIRHDDGGRRNPAADA